MHILTYYHDAFRPGGIPGEVQSLTQALRRDSVEVTLLSKDDLGLLRDRKFWRRFDALLLVDNGSATSPWVARQAVKANVPYVLAPGDILSPFRMQGLAGLKRLAWHRFAFRAMSGSCSAIRVYSNQHAEDLRPWLPSNDVPIVRITEGIDARLLPPAGWSPPTVVPRRFGFLGRLAPGAKGLDVLLRAWGASGVAAGGAELHLRGPQTPEFVSLVRSDWGGGLPDGVVLGGPVEGSAKWDYLASLSVFVHPSRHEGVPRVIREAVICGRPLLVTPQTNFGDLVRQAGCGVVESIDTSSLSQAVRKLSESEALVNMLAGRVNRLREELDWNRIAGKYSTLFSQLT